MIGFVRTALLYATLGFALLATAFRVAEEALGVWVQLQCSRPGTS